jgi:hypothetical protein
VGSDFKKHTKPRVPCFLPGQKIYEEEKRRKRRKKQRAVVKKR